ncbi:MAG: Phosphoserine transaminase [Pycnora praestabilis]|nr:MAG: Phosphoserine transaminase [Pycnora praestabilis]
MPSRSEIEYFGAGPAPLPTSVIEAGAQAFVNFEDMGLGLAEISHRSPTANKVLAEAKENLTALLEIPEDYDILFMQGGGSGEFSAVVYNMVNVWVERRRRKLQAEVKKEDLEQDEKEVDVKVIEMLKKEVEEDLKLDYLVTGSWSLKASQEAASILSPEQVNVALDARQSNGGKFGNIPAEDTWKLTPTRKAGGKGSALIYYCDNETVDGVEFPSFPESLEAKGDNEEDEPLVVADMSSNFISRRVDVKKFAVIFGGAQKNVGITGVTLIIVRKSLLPPHTAHPSPALLRALGLPRCPVTYDYATIAKNNSLYNTLPIFDVWIAGQVMKSLMANFREKRILGQEEVANSKAHFLYETLDKHPEVYQVVPDRTVRSRMNICFRVCGGNAEKEKSFLSGAEELKLQGLKGHRSVGGIRASNYNAVSLEAVQKLVQYLEKFARSQA